MYSSFSGGERMVDGLSIIARLYFPFPKFQLEQGFMMSTIMPRDQYLRARRPE